ncbi:calmodulin-regulated spectrin-associated protein 3-like, partial [Pezoporus flaviventris]|uniref:calmodulin-regulated spectrin-associated protein 3-like n=1 Tax=Pezoporus flaviventris TaxID=889875 RepID=UPI002AB031F4
MVAAPPAAAAAMRRELLGPEIRPLDRYDGARARTAASIAWAMAASYGGAGNVPEALREPLQRGRLVPAVARALSAPGLYCRAWAWALRAPPPPDTAALLELLRSRGEGPTLRERPLQAADLRPPLDIDAHLTLIDSLMGAFVAEATRGLGCPPGAPPGPEGWEQKILCWLDT